MTAFDLKIIVFEIFQDFFLIVSDLNFAMVASSTFFKADRKFVAYVVDCDGSVDCIGLSQIMVCLEFWIFEVRKVRVFRFFLGKHWIIIN